MQKRSSLITPSQTRLLAAAIGCGIGYYLLSLLGIALIAPPDYVSAFWPTNAIILAALLNTQRQHWWLFLLCMFPASLWSNLQADYTIQRCLVYYLGNVVELLFAALMLRQFLPDRIRFEKLNEMVLFLLFAVMLAPLFSATMAATLSSIEAGGGFWQAWRIWYLGNALGHMTLTPCLMLWWLHLAEQRKLPALIRRFEAIAVLMTAVMVSLYAMGFGDHQATLFPALLFLPLPVMLWAALRFGPQGICSVVFIIALMAIYLLNHQQGPFVHSEATASVFSFQLYLVALAVPMMLLGSLFIERRTSLKLLGDSEQRYRMVIEDQLDFIVRWKADGVRTFVNQSYCDYFGVEREQAIGSSFYDYISEADMAVTRERLANLSRENPINAGEHRIIRADGSEGWNYWIDRAIYDQHGKLLEYQSVGRDITEIKNAVEALELSEEKFSKAFDSNPYPVSLSRISDGIILEVNQAFADLFDFPRERLIGHSAVDLGLWANPEVRTRLMQQLQENGHVHRVLADGCTRSGEIRHCELSAELIHIHEVPCSVIFLQDVTERLQAEQEVSESREKLRNLASTLQDIREEERIGIAREIHDELGQALTGLKIDLSRLRDSELVEADRHQRIGQMMDNIDTTIDTVRKISSELRPSVLDDLGLDAAIEWLIQDFSERTGLPCNLDIECRDLDLNQQRDTAVFRICQEALTNIARHSFARRFSVTLLQTGENLELLVGDDGIGVSRSQLRSTRSIGVIGMQERAARVGGELSIENLAESGALVRLVVPLEPPQ